MVRRKHNISKHAMTRGTQRLGVTKNSIHVNARRALSDGLRVKQTTGILHNLLSTYIGSPVVYYANAIFIFGKGNILITVLNVETQFDRDLYRYTTYPTFITYKQNRYKFAKDKTKMNQEIAEGTEYYFNKIKDIAAPHEVAIKHVEPLKSMKFRVWFTSSLLPDDITSKITEETGLEVGFVGDAIYDDNELLKELKKDIRKWFVSKGAIFPKVKHIDEEKVIIQIDTMSDKIKIKDHLQTHFEEKFCRKLWVELKEK